MNANVQYMGGQQNVIPKRVYYSGTDQLKTGYAMCYAHDADVAATDPKLARGTLVAKPATANLMFFAGVVAPSSNNVTGPAWIDVIPAIPGCLADGWFASNVNSLGVACGPQNASYALAALSDSTFNYAHVANTAETGDKSSSNGTLKVYFV